MSGVPNPVFPIVEPFAINAAAEYIVFPIPVPDQTLTIPGAASFDLGFGPLNMTNLAAGGIPPRGKDFNGIFRMITQYSALMQAGQIVPFDATAVAAFGGYKIGARIVSTSGANPGLVWTNLNDGNTNDPDTNPAGWYADKALFVGAALAGAQNNVVLPQASDLVFDFDTNPGALDISGFVALRDGQRLTVSNVGPNLLQILANSALSAAANRIRAATDLALVTSQSLTLQYVSALQRWILP